MFSGVIFETNSDLLARKNADTNTIFLIGPFSIKSIISRFHIAEIKALTLEISGLFSLSYGSSLSKI